MSIPFAIQGVGAGSSAEADTPTTRPEVEEARECGEDDYPERDIVQEVACLPAKHV